MKPLPPAARRSLQNRVVVQGEPSAAQLKPIPMSDRPAATTSARAPGMARAIAATAPV